MSIDNFKSCDQCKFKEDYGGWKFYCRVGPTSRPCGDMRQPRGMCGPDGNMWERKGNSVHGAEQRD